MDVASGHEALNRWPRIRRWLHIDSGRVDDDFAGWLWRAEERLRPDELAASYEEWADFYQWHREQRTAELADDRVKCHLVDRWTDSMTYCCQRSAVWARGDNPGECVPQHQRRPDLAAEGEAIVAGLVAALNTRGQVLGPLALAG